MPTLDSLRNLAMAPIRALTQRRSASDMTGSWHRLNLALAGGARVDETAMLGLASAWACISAISTDLSFMPLSVMRKYPNGTRKPQVDDPRHALLHDTPDGARTAMRWRQSAQAHILGWGNGIAEIKRDSDGWPTRLVLQPAGQTTTYERTSDGGIGYRLHTGRRVRAENVLHVAGLGPDGLNGWTPIRYHRETFGLSLAMSRFGLSFFGNSSVPGGYIKHPGRLSNDAAKRLIERFEAALQGPDKAFSLTVLDEGMSWEQAAVNPQDSQYLLLRSFQVAEICRIFRVPLHKICDYSQVQLASAGVEAMNLDYLTTTIVPWCVAWEQELDLKLFTAAERRAGFYTRFNVAALLRGDSRSRAEFYEKMVLNGIYSRDEVRALEDLDPIGAVRGGDKYTVQGQMIDLAAVGSEPQSTGTPPAPETP